MQMQGWDLNAPTRDCSVPSTPLGCNLWPETSRVWSGRRIHLAVYSRKEEGSMMRHRTTYLALCIAALLLLKAWSAPGQDVTFDRLLQAEKDPNNWITYFRDYRG